jgi:hypothetical protein
MDYVHNKNIIKKYNMWIYFLIFLLILIMITVNTPYFNITEEHFTAEENKEALLELQNLRAVLGKQTVISNKELNKEYEQPNNFKINNTYRLLKKDPVETKIRQNAEANAGYTHERPDVKNPYKTDGYSYINPALWDVPQQRPPVCIPQKGYESIVQPIPTTGTPLEALDWQETLPKFTYNQVYDPKYYYPGYQSI